MKSRAQSDDFAVRLNRARAAAQRQHGVPGNEPEDETTDNQAQSRIPARKGSQKGSQTHAQTLALGLGARLASELLAAFLVAGAMGLLIDRIFKTTPWGMLAGLALGFAAGILNVIRATKNPDKVDKNKVDIRDTLSQESNEETG